MTRDEIAEEIEIGERGLHSRDLAEQGGEVGARYASALADGMVSPDEAAGLLPLVRELARTLTTLEHDLAATVRERGRRLRSMGGGRS